MLPASTGDRPSNERPVTYVQRSRFLVAGAGLLVVAHGVDVWWVGGADWAALGLRLAWAGLLLLEARALVAFRRAALRVTTVLVSLGTPALYTALVWVTGGSQSPLFPFSFVLAMAAAIVLFDLFAVGMFTALLTVAGALAVLVLDGAPGRTLVAWGHIGVVALVSSAVLAHAFRATQLANQRLIAELREAIGNVKTLKGLLPVCAWCHRIRNDAGYWEKLEAYISAHSEAEFSHGMCPACLAKHYPDEVPVSPGPAEPNGEPR